MSNESQVEGTVADAVFTLKIHRGEGMVMLAMNWKATTPPVDFVGFAIEYQEPGGAKFFAVKNRLNFDGNAGSVSSGKRPPTYSTLVAPIQKFRWVHFPFNADLPGDFIYRVTPVFMSATGDLSYGVAQLAAITLARETYPGVLNVAFTRGFVSSQAFVDNYLDDGPIETLLPGDAKTGLTFTPTHKDTAKALDWMGFEARREMLDLLDAAIADPTAKVSIVAFDFNLPDVLSRVKALGARVRVILDDSKDHHGNGAAEDAAETDLIAAGIAVRRQHMGDLQHNKTMIVDGTAVQKVICGSTNMSWRGLYVQSNNALVLTGAAPVAVFTTAFENYWNEPAPTPGGHMAFPSTPSAQWANLGLTGIDAQVAFSPHSASNSVLKTIADDLRTARSSIFYSLAFLSITPGLIRDALGVQSSRDDLFVAGISDQKAGVVVAASSSNQPPTYVAALDGDAPPPFSNEPTGLAGKGGGTRMHHKFIVMDFDQVGARVYLGSYNMSKSADGSNGENLVLVRDRRVATSYMIEAVRIIDHYQFRVAQKVAATARQALTLQRPPAAGGVPWWAEDYDQPQKAKDRLLFA